MPSEKHIVKEGSRQHVIRYDTQGKHCSEPNCEINKVKPKTPPACADSWKDGYDYGVLDGEAKGRKEAFDEVFPEFDKLLKELDGIFSYYIVTRQSQFAKPLEKWNKKYEKFKKSKLKGVRK